MSEERPSEILGSLPRSRPHRRSEKRPAAVAAKQGDGAPPKQARAASTKQAQSASARKRATRATSRRSQALRQPKQPGGTPPRPAKRTVPAVRGGRTPPAPSPSARRGDVFSTVVHAAAELTEIGLSVSGRALRGALGRLPRP